MAETKKESEKKEEKKEEKRKSLKTRGDPICVCEQNY